MYRSLSVLACLALVACGSEVEEPPRELILSELTPPAGEGSREPYLSSSGDAVYLSWQESTQGHHRVRVARLDGTGWGQAGTVAEGTDHFVNWADFPSVVEGADGRVWAHWLQRVEGPGLAYAVRLAHSSDDGLTWSEPWTPHEDGTPTEHGFVTLFPWGEGVGMTWLDGRNYAPGPDGAPPTREMTVRFRQAGGPDAPGPEVLLDARACDCCQTDVALAADGPVAVYRNRTEDEVRDVYVTRLTPDGWTEGVPVHDDGWVIGGCPVNGPAVDALGSSVAVAWFTGAGDTARVRAAFSSDGGRSFTEPVRVDDGNPAGRVDLRMRADGSALVTWLERTDGDGAQLRVARLDAEAGRTDAWTVSESSAARASGFPRMALPPWDAGAALIAWTDVTDPERPRVRVAHVELPR